MWRWTGIGLVVAGALVVAACGGGGASEDRGRVERDAVVEQDGAAGQTVLEAASQAEVPRVVDEAMVESESLILAEGTWELPAADAFGAAGFHDVLEAAATLPADLGETAGRRLVLALRDVSRPGEVCGSEHPLSGCATVDWSDFEGRPGVPESGVFENRVSFGTVAGESTLYLSETGVLAVEPDGFAPG